MTDNITNPVQSKKWIYGLDSIRFSLAVIVMLGHFPGTLNAFQHTTNKALNTFLKINANVFCGPAAVITFFVISGFVIHYPNRNKENFDVGSFLIRRVLRIGLPLVIIGLIAVYFNHFDSLPVWSLYCEMIYYVIYPVLFKLNVSWRKLFFISFALSYIIVLVFNFDSFKSFIHQSNINYQGQYWQLGIVATSLIGAPCWLLGVNLASVIDEKEYDVKFTKLILYRFVVLIMSIMILTLHFHFYLGYIYTLNIFALLVYLWLEKEILYYRNHKPTEILEFGGKFSYSLYLCHGLIIVFFIMNLNVSLLTYFMIVLFVLVISYIIYLIVELPSHKLAQLLSSKTKKS